MTLRGRRDGRRSGVVNRILGRLPRVAGLTDEALAGVTAELRRRLAGSEDQQVLLADVFAAGLEALRRGSGFVVDKDGLLAAWVAQRGAIADVPPHVNLDGPTMLAVYPWALSHGVHIITVDDPATERTTQQLHPVCQLLGLTVGLLHPDLPLEERRRAYQADVVVGSCAEFSLDYLRDHLAWERLKLVQHGLPFALVQQADTILGDRCRVESIISGPVEREPWWHALPEIVPALERDRDYRLAVGEARLTRAGENKLVKLLGSSVPLPERRTDLMREAEWLVGASGGLRRGRDYVVRDGMVVCLDEQGNSSDRRYAEGVHQAIEAREGVAVSLRRMDLAKISYCDYLRHYDRLAGLSTGAWPAWIFADLYGLDVVRVAGRRVFGARRDQAGQRRGETDLRWLYQQWWHRERVVADQRDLLYQRRQRLLTGEVEVGASRSMIREAVQALAERHLPLDLPGLHAAATAMFPVAVDVPQLRDLAADGTRLVDLLQRAAEHAWRARQQELGIDAFTVLVRKVELSVIDKEWREHLRTVQRLEHVTELTDYTRTTAAAFDQLLANLSIDTLGYVLNVNVNDSAATAN